MSNNVDNLLQYILAHRIGHKFTCATSQYAENTTAPGFRFDEWSTAAAVRSLTKKGFIESEYGWRYYDCKVISHTGHADPIDYYGRHESRGTLADSQDAREFYRGAS